MKYFDIRNQTFQILYYFSLNMRYLSFYHVPTTCFNNYPVNCSIRSSCHIT